MGYMEIARIASNGLKIKGKTGTIAIDSLDKGIYQALLVTDMDALGEKETLNEQLIITGPGEYEVAGIKIIGLAVDASSVYILIVDSVTIAIGKLSALQKTQSKLQEHDIVIAKCTSLEPASFLSPLSSHVVILYGDHAPEVAQTFGEEHVQTLGKYSVTKEKLPTEAETILLSNS